MNDEDRQEIAAVRTWYDRTAEAFDERYAGPGGEFWESFEERVAMELLGTSLNRVLDLGCGPGRLASSLSARANEVLEVDLSPAMIFLARRKPHSANVRYLVIDATRTALASESVDAVISLGMFEYLANPSPFLAEIFRVLRPGGQVVFTCHSEAPALVRAARVAKRSLMPPRGGRSSVPGQGFDRRVQHRPASMLQLLREHGFQDAGFRGFHFTATVRMFRMGTALKSVSAKIDQWLGRSVVRTAAPLAMYSARKAKSR